MHVILEIHASRVIDRAIKYIDSGVSANTVASVLQIDVTQSQMIMDPQ